MRVIILSCSAVPRSVQKYFFQSLSLVILSFATSASAEVIVDQSFLGLTPNAGFNLAEGFAYVGQTVTPGVTGQLVSVEINVGRRSEFLVPWVLDIQQVVGGAATGVVLSSTTIASNNFPLSLLPVGPNLPLSLSVAMNVGIPFQAGEQFAIVLHPQGITGAPGLNAGYWSEADGYVGGDTIAGPNANALTPYVAGTQTFDLHFRTYMFVVPEPSAAALSAIGLLVVFVLYGRRKFNAHTRSDVPTEAVSVSQ